MTTEQTAALRSFGGGLDLWLTRVRDALAAIKGDDVVDDDQCDEAAAGLRAIAERFNEAALGLGLPAVDVPDPLDPSPYQEDDDAVG